MQPTTFDKRAYAVFKGGGVAGIAHVGALQELQKTFEFVGYAGTSAGSLVALLAAARLTPEQMADALRRLELKSLVGPYRYLVRSAPFILLIGILCFVAWLAAWFFTGQHPPVWLGWLLAIVGLTETVLLGYVNLSLGLVPKKRLQEFLIKEVTAKIPSFDQYMTFREFREAGGKPLKVFATDLSGKALRPFSESHDDDRIPVIQAVVASAAFPLFFSPGKILGHCMTDGGIACNLPVFCFDQELGEQRLPVIAFDLTWKEHPKEGRLWIIEFLVRLVTTAIQSHDAIIENLTTRVSRLKITVPEEIDAMDFSLTDAQRNKLFEAGREAVKKFLLLESIEPRLLAQSLVQYVQAQYVPETVVVPLLKNFCREARENLGVAEPRACIFMAISESLRRIVYHTFDEGDPDIGIELTLGEGITGIAWATRSFAFGVLRERAYRLEEGSDCKV